MAYQFPPDVEKLVQEQMAQRGYRSEDELLLDALRVFRAIQDRQEQLLADVKLGIDQADQGSARPLDVDALISRCTLQLAEEGIID